MKGKIQRIPNATFAEIFYADDTICLTGNTGSAQRLLRTIERHSERYGMALNYDKCELIQFNDNGKVRFQNGKVVRKTHKAKYLGCEINDASNVMKEVKARKAACIGTWKNWSSFGKSLTAQWASR